MLEILGGMLPLVTPATPMVRLHICSNVTVAFENPTATKTVKRRFYQFFALTLMFFAGLKLQTFFTKAKNKVLEADIYQLCKLELGTFLKNSSCLIQADSLRLLVKSCGSLLGICSPQEIQGMV